VSDYETTQRTRNIIVGIFVIVAMFALVWLIFKFGDLPTVVGKFRSFQVFVQFPIAQGVWKNTSVHFCGYEIGSVTEVMAPQMRTDLDTGLEYHQTVVILSINKKYVNIPSNVEVKLMTRGLGSSYIEIKAPRPDPNRPVTEFLAEGSLLQGSTGMTSEFFPEESQEKLDKLADSLGTLVNSASSILGDEKNRENIKTTLANLSDASKQATQTLKELQEFFTAGTDASAELSKALAELRLILEKVNSGQGTAAKLINDGRLYENLLENTQQMQVLLEELKAFSKKVDDKGFLPIKLK
jgi:phospholipid/cholesterol/gamma-HCH transport system substrate-binding protein